MAVPFLRPVRFASTCLAVLTLTSVSGCGTGEVMSGGVATTAEPTYRTTDWPTAVQDPPVAVVEAPTSYIETIRGTDIEFEMTWVAEGGFWIGTTEVTWDAFLPYCDFKETGLVPPGVDAVSKPSKPLTEYDRGWGMGQRPAVGVSWNAAKTYCVWLSINTSNTYRLPTEDEWRLACGPGGHEPLADHAWHDENSDGKTQEAGTREPNEYGLYDMLGNLWEYCANPYDPAKPDRAVLRGGSWKDEAETVTPEHRLRFDNDWTLDDPNMPPGVWWIPDGDHLGFRLLRPGPGSEPDVRDDE